MLASICFALTLTSCGSSDFTRFSELGGLRIVAVQVEDQLRAGVAEIDGNSTSPVTMRVTTYISDLNAEGRGFQVTVTGCVDPGVSQGAGFRCLDPQVIAFPNGGTFDTNLLSATRFTGSMTSFDLVINNPAELLSGRSDVQKFNGVNYLLNLTLTSGEESLSVIKSIPITTRILRNRNPEIDEVLLDGNALTSGPTTGGNLNLRLTPNGAAEVYEEMAFDGQITSQIEEYLITWFYSEGRVRPFRTVETQQPELVLRTSGPVLLMAVVRDRRGGVAVRVY